MKTWFVFAALAFCAASASRSVAVEGPTATLVKPGHRTVIVHHDGWKPSVWYDWGGHQILQRFFREITGENVPVISESKLAELEQNQPFDTRIWVGRQPAVDRVVGERLDAIDDDGFVIRSLGSDVFVAGKHWWGDNWAAHDLLERFAGCRWYGPEPEFWKPEQGVVGLFDVVPRRESIAMPADASIVEEPSYKMRWFRFMPLHSFRLRYRDSFHHALVGILPPEKYAADHPEYYPLLGGKRKVPGAGDFRWQPCVSNPAVVEIVANAAIDHFRQNPAASSFSLGMNDTDAFCECEACLRQAPGALRETRQRQAWAFFHFYNEVAKKVEKEFPDKRLGCLAYAGLSVLPAGTIELHPMLVPYLTRDSAQLFDDAQKAEFDETVATWKGLSRRMGIYEYMYGGGFVVPRIYHRFLAENLQNRYGAGVDGFYAESYPNWGLDGPKYWLVSRLLWDHEADADKLLDQWHGDLFGPAADDMKQYFALLENTWCEQTLASDRSNYRWYLDAKQLEIFPPDICEQAWQLLGKAESKTDDPTIRKRIAYFRNTFNVSRTLSRRYSAAAELDRRIAEPATNGLAEPAALAPLLAALETWLEVPSVAKTEQQVPDGALDRNVTKDFSRYDRQPVAAVAALVDALSRHSLGAADHQTSDSRRKAIEAALHAATSRLTDTKAEKSAELLKRLAHDAALLRVTKAERSPVLDGRIDQGEWPEASYRGRYFRAHSLDEQAETSAVYAATSDGSLYLAFDLEQDPATVGDAVTEKDTGGWKAPLMAGDDCISLTFRSGAGGFRSVRINAAGALGYHDADWPGVVRGSAARKTDTGWQAELALDLKTLGITADNASDWTIAIARFTRRQRNDNTPKPPTWETVAYTQLPAPPGEGIIGRGNHVQLMTFITGPRLLFED